MKAILQSRALCIVRRIAVVTFVVWHLLFLFLTNAAVSVRPSDTEAPTLYVGRQELGAWFARPVEPVIKVVKGYESYLAIDQWWGMFGSPVARYIPFPAARIKFNDGSTVVVTSANDPDDMTRFLRIGGTRQRKLEAHLLNTELDERQVPMQRRLAESFVARWREENPTDQRKPVSVTLLIRTYRAPVPGDRWEKQPALTLQDLPENETEREKVLAELRKNGGQAIKTFELEAR